MPFISDAASAIKSRFGFHDHPADPARTTPSVAKSASRDNLNLAQASAFRSVRDCFDNDSDVDEDGDQYAASSSRSFEFSEDPAFWKDHNVQVSQIDSVTFVSLSLFVLAQIKSGLSVV